VGGFSLVSLASDLPHCTLAIKRSQMHPASQYVHDVLQISNLVQIRVGEETCVWKPPSSSNPNPSSIVCIAGGFGITPILPIYQSALLYYYRNHHDVASANSFTTAATADSPPPATTKYQQQQQRPMIHLYYSVSCQDEWVYGNKILELYHQHAQRDRDRICFTLTRQTEWQSPTPDPNNGKEWNNGITFQCGGRQLLHSFLKQQPSDRPPPDGDKEDVSVLDDNIHSKNSVYYICGPPAMMDDAVCILKNEQGVPDTQLHFEKWW
jgi:ferredoxin-NADP reductase